MVDVLQHEGSPFWPVGTLDRQTGPAGEASEAIIDNEGEVNTTFAYLRVNRRYCRDRENSTTPIIRFAFVGCVDARSL